MNKQTMHHIMRPLLVAAALTAAQFSGAQVVTNWAAFNDYVPSASTHPNANIYNLRGVAGTPPQPTEGFLKDFATGDPTAAYLIATATGTPDFFGGIAYPNAGTPAYNLFNGIVDLGNTDSAIGIRSSANSTVTLTFSNLNPSQRYIFRGTTVRGNSYARRWTLVSLRGADSFVDAHTAGVYTRANFATGTMTNGQAAYNSGENRAEGALVGWDNIDPGPDGVIVIKNEQYVDNPLPNGQTPDLGTYGYAFSGIYLAEVGSPTPATITVNPPANVTVEQNRPLLLVANAQGAPAPVFQWYKDNAPIPGATARTYSVPLAQASDSGAYYLVASNSLNRATSTVAQVVVFADTNGPVLLSARTDDTFQRIFLTWNETITHDPAIEFGSYIINDPSGNQVFVTGVEHNGSNVVLNLAPAILITDTNYSIELDYQTDLVGNVTKPVGTPLGGDPNGIVTNFHTFNITRGLTLFQAYLNLPAGQTVAQFTNMPIYPNGPTFSFYTNILNWPQSAPVNIEQYAMRFTGLFIAPETGIHRFDPAHDDEGFLRIYSTPHPGGTFSEMNPACCTALTGGPTLDVDMVAGQAYYYELIVREFGGGDYAGIGVTLPSSTVIAPITGQYLAVAADPTVAPNAGISQQPQNQTVAANHAATFSVTVTNAGGIVGYQWQVDTGSGFTDVTGANNASHTTPLQPLGNSGHQYRVIVTVPGRTIVSSPATLTVINDTFAPRVTSVHGTRSFNGVTVFFDEGMDPASLVNLSNYELRDSGNNVVALSSPVASADNRSVTFSTPGQGVGAFYTMRVQNVTDVVGNALALTNVTFQTWVYTPGFVLKELWLGLPTGTVSLDDLTNRTANPNYPDRPSLVRLGDLLELNTFDEFEGYGARLSGAIIPPVSGNYTFYFAADDNGVFFLSTDASPTTLYTLPPIAREPVWSGRRTWTGEAGGGGRIAAPSPSGQPANIATNVNLVAGQMYYFEAFVKEGGGGDNLAVAWQLPGAPVPLNGSLPIEGRYLAVLADPVGAVITVSQQPASITATQGQAVTFTIAATGTNVNGNVQVLYQWQTLVGGTFTNIAGATGSSYSTAALTSGAQYRALLFIPGATATSSVATVTIGAGQPRLRFNLSGPDLVLSWDAGSRLQWTGSLTPPVTWKDIDTAGATTYTVVRANEFSVNLDTAQEPPPRGTGSGRGTVSLSNNVLVVDVSYSGMSGTRNNSHFHAPAPRGVNTGVAYNLAALDSATGQGTNGGTIRGTVTLTDGAYGGKNIAAQLQDLRGGLWYLNVHSTAFPGGEIRGQVDPPVRFYRLVSP